MKINLLLVGKTSAAYLREGIELYTSRLSHYADFEIRQLADIKSTRSMTEAVQKQREGEAMLACFQPGDWVVLLDERGREFTSREFASTIEKRLASGGRNIWFVIGGPYGFSDAVYARANEKISFSRMTFSHEMIRLLFVEQLYRAFTILRGEPYHHD